MSAEPYRPTRREERRAATVREIKALAMEQISSGGPDAVSLSGIVREMSMSPAAIYRYFENRDALLAELVVDAYDALADALAAVRPRPRRGTADDHLVAVLHGIRRWALAHPNAYLLIFQTSLGSGKELAAERTVLAASRSMGVIVTAIAAVAADAAVTADAAGGAPPAADLAGGPAMSSALASWADRSGLGDFPPAVLLFAVRSWTRLHGVISLELGGHLSSAGIDPGLLYQAEVEVIAGSARM